MRLSAAATGILAALVAAGCETTPPEPYDYTLFLEHTPRSILVLPPLNESLEVEATDIYLSTVTEPLAERGYYVFPVAVVQMLMRENGLPTAGEMHQVSLTKLDEIFGADAVLYITIEDWGTSYHLIDSASVVHLRGKLVDVQTGLLIWEGRAEMEEHSASGGGDPIGLVIGALVSQIVSTTVYDPEESLSRTANFQLVRRPEHGLLLGPRHPNYAESREALRQEMFEREAAAEAAEDGGSDDDS